jgi:hypothetical protein
LNIHHHKIYRMLKFNSNGLLIPDINIQSDIVELESIFVTSVSTRRVELFEKYISYTNSLKVLCNNSELTQWVDGSFVTKIPEPGDIDVVTFIDFTVLESLNDTLSNYKYPASQDIFGVDAYLVKVYPPEHRYYFSYQSDRTYWMGHFSKTKRNRLGNKLKKGFLEINM